MFIVGAELRAPAGVRAQLKSRPAWVAVLSVLLPMGLGLAIAPWLYPELAPAGVGFWPFALFMATAMSITAFPVLARILKDRGMTRTPLGQLALGSAAIADVLAWILLALVVALIGSGEGAARFRQDHAGHARARGAGLRRTASAVCVAAATRLDRWPADADHARGADDRPVRLRGGDRMAAPARGVRCVPVRRLPAARRSPAALPGRSRIEVLAVVALLPIFFALAGLNTTSDAFVGAGLGTLALIVAVAVIGKIVGGTAGARLGGHGWRDSLGTGALMNARGLMELIVIKVGLDAGLIGRSCSRCCW